MSWIRRWTAAATAVVAVVLLIGCEAGTGTGTDGTGAASLVAASEVPARVVVGSAVELVVEVRDGEGAPVAGEEVEWSTTSGSVASARSRTDAEGRAGTVWTVGTEAGTTAEALVRRGSLQQSFGTELVAGAGTSVVVEPDTMWLRALEATARVGGVVLDAWGNVAEGQLSWRSTASDVASLSGDTVRAVNSGAGLVIAEWNALADTVVVEVWQVPARVTLSPDSTAIGETGTVQLSAAAADSNGHAIAAAAFTWASETEGIATVDATGLVTAQARGTATIRATAAPASAVAKVTVREDAVPDALTLSHSSYQMEALLDTLRVSATVWDQFGTPMDVTVAWASSDAAVVTVDGGEVVARANGTARVVATYSGLADTLAVEVRQVADSLWVSPKADTLDLGATTTLTAAAKDANDAAIPSPAVTWTSSGPGVATVSAGPGGVGEVTGVTPGEVAITAALDGLTTSATIRVLPAPEPAVVFSWDTVDGYVDSATKVDTFRIDLHRDTAYNLFVEDLSGAKTYDNVVTGVYAPDGTTRVASLSVGYGSGALLQTASGRFTPGITGTHTVRVSGRGGLYRFVVVPIDPAAEGGSRLAVGGTASERVDVLGDRDDIRFSAPVGTRANLFLQAHGARDAYYGWLKADVYRPDGVNLVASVTTTGVDAEQRDNATGTFTVTEAGDYIVRVSALATMKGYTGDYSLELFPIDSLPETRAAGVLVGDEVSETLEPLGDIDVFEFNGAAGQELVVFLQTVEQFADGDLWLDVHGPSGARIASVTDLFDAGERQLRRVSTGVFTAPATGTYRVRVGGVHTATAGGDEASYRFEVFVMDRAPEVVNPAVALGDTITGELIDPTGDVDELVFRAAAGATLNGFFQVQSGATDSLRLEIVHPNGSVLAARTSHLWQAGHDLLTLHTGRFTAPLDTTYTVRVSGRRRATDGDIGPYRFMVRTVDPAPEWVAAALAVGDTVQGERLDFAGDVDTFAFAAAGDELVRIHFQALSGKSLDQLWLTLRDPSGTAVASVGSVGTDGSLDVRYSPELALSAGTYTVTVEGNDASIGGFRFEVRRTN